MYRVVDIGPGVFQTAKNETMLLFFQSSMPSSASIVEVTRTTPKAFLTGGESFTARQVDWTDVAGGAWLVHLSPERARVVRHMQESPRTLGDLCTVNQGLRTGNNDEYLSTSSRGGLWKPAAGGYHTARGG